MDENEGCDSAVMTRKKFCEFSPVFINWEVVFIKTER